MRESMPLNQGRPGVMAVFTWARWSPCSEGAVGPAPAPAAEAATALAAEEAPVSLGAMSRGIKVRASSVDLMYLRRGWRGTLAAGMASPTFGRSAWRGARGLSGWRPRFAAIPG